MRFQRFSGPRLPGYLSLGRSFGGTLGLVAGVLPTPQPANIDDFAAAADLGQWSAPLGRVGTKELEPLQLAPKPKQLLLGLDGGFGRQGFRGQTAPQPEGELLEVGVGLGRSAEQLEAFVFVHGTGEGNCPNHTTRLRFPPADPHPRKNPAPGVP